MGINNTQYNTETQNAQNRKQNAQKKATNIKRIIKKNITQLIRT